MAGAAGDFRALLRQLVVAGGEFLGSVFLANAMCTAFLLLACTHCRALAMHRSRTDKGKGAVLAAPFQLLQYETFPENPI